MDNKEMKDLVATLAVGACNANFKLGFTYGIFVGVVTTIFVQKLLMEYHSKNKGEA